MSLRPLFVGLSAPALLAMAAGSVAFGSTRFELKSPDFPSGGSLPSVYTCDGSDTSPALSWKGVPSQAKSLVLILEDPDAPDPKAPSMTWSHWLIYNLPAHEGELEVGQRDLPAGASMGLNDWNRPIYNGPCPTTGRHRYFFRLLALKSRLKVQAEFTRESLLKDARRWVLAEARWMGTYQRTPVPERVPERSAEQGPHASQRESEAQPGPPSTAMPQDALPAVPFVFSTPGPAPSLAP